MSCKFYARGRFNCSVTYNHEIKYSFYDEDGSRYMIYAQKDESEAEVIRKALNQYTGNNLAVSGDIVLEEGELKLVLKEWGMVIDGKVYNPEDMSEGYRRV